MKKSYIVATLILSLAFAPFVSAQQDIELETEIDIALTDIAIDDISEAELTEAEPSDLPDVAEDEQLAEDLAGQMLLDVEGNGEVYYVDPVDGGKEYLSDGQAAHRLLERRALGINEENFAKLVQGTEKNESSVCESNELGQRLRGRIVLRVDQNGEAWWVLPTNCRAYYVGTHEAAYELMKEFSLGITKQNLGKIRDTARQKLKRAVRFSVYAYAEEHDVTLDEARQSVEEEVQGVRACVKEGRIELDDDTTRVEVKTRIRSCYAESDLPKIDRERLQEIKSDIQEARRERIEHRLDIREIKVKERRSIKLEA